VKGKQLVVNVKDRRGGPRVEIKMIVSQLGEARNLSEGGMCMRSHSPFALGSPTNVEFSLPDSEATIRCWGEIVWNRRLPDERGYEAGLKFVSISKEDRGRIAAFVADHPDLAH
jgi:c-di-GMP-binding flagellar brake protein YcgR